jgi:hypothetical protein
VDSSAVRTDWPQINADRRPLSLAMFYLRPSALICGKCLR